MSSSQFDIVIAGAGMVGASAALALARNGLRIALIEPLAEARDIAPESTDYALRVSAISPRSRAILRRLGVWQRLEPARICDYEKMRIWHQHGTACVDFDAVELARDNLGAILENRLLQQGLYRACDEQAQIEWLRPDAIETLLENDAQGVALRMASGRYINGSLLLAADGRGSATRELAGIAVQAGNYRQTAIVANVVTSLSHDNIARQRFLATGPLAFLPLANGQSSIVWSCDNQQVGELIEADATDFCRLLGAAFEFSLGEVLACGERANFALGWHRCEHWLKGRVLVIGDAAHSVHPLAGQGVNLGFSDVDLLARLITDKTQLSRQRVLRRFERQRKSETWLAGNGFSALKSIYGIDQAFCSGLRDLGMRCVNRTPWLKRAMMQTAIENIC